ncbi:ABC transporter ATP-binding protein [Risungbinella massiliensis]|uniref:ABC transporter ATP-binding protein n=1 Tax=Risungbinella massiliensis TaxID=1329796 RepID=UPI0005CBCA7C|nr:ABC transporter ATP-binding protein [Risungbinella massiliensis]
MTKKLVCDELSFGYEQHKPILHQLSLYVAEGEFVSLIGPSGSGKSTLFYLLGGLYTPKQGEIELDGRSIIGKRGCIGYVPQQASLLPWRTVEQNVRLSLEIGAHPKKIDVDSLLMHAGLQQVAHAYPHQLSGGMQQRVAFIRALAQNHSLLCLDEPFASLDALTRFQMQRWLMKVLEEESRTVLLITHSIEEALLLSDRIYLLGANPMQVREEFSIPHPREERLKWRESPDFVSWRKKLEELLFEAKSVV